MVITKHAINRMRQRHITCKELKESIKTGIVIWVAERPEARKHVAQNGIVVITGRDNVVVTAYRDQKLCNTILSQLMEEQNNIVC